MEMHKKQRGIIKRDQVRLAENGPRTRATPAAGISAESPRVRLVTLEEHGEHAQAFEFTCSCGEVSLIEIQYPEKS